jgi:calcium permeable stress-gated cation channel
MTVMPAANPHDIFWRNVGLPHQARRSGLLASLAATAVLCLFYSIPMAFITSLTELNSLKESLPRLAVWIEAEPTRERLLAQVAPLILLLFNETILPSTLKYFATWEGHISSAMLEASLFVKLGCFMVRAKYGVLMKLLTQLTLD